MVLVSAIHQLESAIGIHMSSSFEPLSHLPPYPSRLSQTTGLSREEPYYLRDKILVRRQIQIRKAIFWNLERW